MKILQRITKQNEGHFKGMTVKTIAEAKCDRHVNFFKVRDKFKNGKDSQVDQIHRITVCRELCDV